MKTIENKSVGMAVKTLSRNIKKYFEMNAPKDEKPGKKPTENQARIMQFIYENSGRPIYQKDIEDYLKVSPPTCSETLKLMEKTGYIHREYETTDARLKKITLTPETEEIQSHVCENIRKLDSAMLAGISDEDLQIFLAVAEQINKNVTGVTDD